MRRRQRRAWAIFAILAVSVTVVDQIVKAYVAGHYAFDTINPLVGDWLRIVLIQNSGGLFGLFQNQVQGFAAVSVIVVAFLVALELRSGWRHWLTTLALGLLLGGAVGNFIDRVTLSYVRDFFDIGIGGWRFYIFNVADAAITIAIALLFLIAFISPRSVFIDSPDEEAVERPVPDAPASREQAGERVDA